MVYPELGYKITRRDVMEGGHGKPYRCTLKELAGTPIRNQQLLLPSSVLNVK
jgi:hypothetical protein